MVNKGVIIEILDFELGAFSENLKHIMNDMEKRNFLIISSEKKVLA